MISLYFCSISGHSSARSDQRISRQSCASVRGLVTLQVFMVAAVIRASFCYPMTTRYEHFDTVVIVFPSMRGKFGSFALRLFTRAHSIISPMVAVANGRRSTRPQRRRGL